MIVHTTTRAVLAALLTLLAAAAAAQVPKTAADHLALVERHGVVRTARVDGGELVLFIASDAGVLTARLPWSGPRPERLVDGEVSVRGVWRPTHDTSAPGRTLQVKTPKDLMIVREAPSDAFDTRLVPLGELLQLPSDRFPRHRIRVAAVVTAHLSPRRVHLTDGEHDLRVESVDDTVFVPGDIVEAVGFASARTGQIRLVNAIVRRVGRTVPPRALRVDVSRLLDERRDGSLVQIDAVLVRRLFDSDDYELVLRADDVTFEASLLVPADVAPLERLADGSRVEVTGIARVRGARRGDPASVELRLRDAADVRVLASPPWWTGTRGLYLLGFVLVGFVTSTGWVVALRRRLPAIEQARLESEERQQSAELALRERDAQLQQAQKLEAVGRLAGGIAHDFNNLLTVIAGNVDFALDAARQNRQPSLDHLLDIQDAARSAAGLTRQLLSFSRRQRVEPTVLDVNLVVAGFESMVGRLIGEDIRLIVRLHGDPLYVRADRVQLEQVLTNLAVNARDAMSDGGVLDIETHLDGPNVLIDVSDTGCGMSAEVRAHVFEPFFTTKESGRGTGLGLATVYGAVTQNGGTIGVDSEVGCGTRIRIALPRVESSAEPSHERRSEEVGRPASGSETVLLVEDEPALRGVAKRALERHGYRVLAAANGTEALRVAESHGGEIDLLLSDLVMPDVNGVEVARRVTSTYPNVRVLLMSGYTDHPALKNQSLPELATLLQKPFTPKALATAVRDLLDCEMNGPAHRAHSQPAA